MTPEQTGLLNWLFIAGGIDGDPKACPADQMRANVEYVEQWLAVPRNMQRDGRAVLMTEALDALVAFYLETRGRMMKNSVKGRNKVPLPAGAKCDDCRFFETCRDFIFIRRGGERYCQWRPSQFTEKDNTV